VEGETESIVGLREKFVFRLQGIERSFDAAPCSVASGAYIQFLLPRNTFLKTSG
jgi:hypothetical protein